MKKELLWIVEILVMALMLIVGTLRCIEVQKRETDPNADSFSVALFIFQYSVIPLLFPSQKVGVIIILRLSVRIWK